MSGIVSYGVSIPKFRLKLADIAHVWKKDPNEIVNGLQVTEKAVPNFDEDAVTLAVAAGFAALQSGNIDASKIESIFVGSESHPYAVNPSSTIVADALGLLENIFAADLEFACKAATAGLQITMGLLDSKKISYGLVIGSDTAQAKPHDVLEYTAAAAACALVVGNKKSEIIAEILDTSSVTSNTPDFWRRDGQKYPSHFGRFTGEPAYFQHVVAEGRKLLKKNNAKPSDFSYCVFHMPNGKFPRVAAKTLGFTDNQLASSLVVKKIGNPYSASALIGLAAVLDIAKPNEKIFFVSYGSGAGSDGFIFETTERIMNYELRIKENKVQKLVANKTYISYAEYLQMTHKI